jgi:hypothetical protein
METAQEDPFQDPAAYLFELGVSRIVILIRAVSISLIRGTSAILS